MMMGTQRPLVAMLKMLLQLREKDDSEEGIVYHCPFPRTSGCARAELQLCGDMHDFLKFASSSRFLFECYLYGIGIS